MWDPDRVAQEQVARDRRESRQRSRADRQRRRLEPSEPPPYVPTLEDYARELLGRIRSQRRNPTPTVVRRSWGRKSTVACWVLGEHEHDYPMRDGYSHVTRTYALFSDGVVRWTEGSYRTLFSNLLEVDGWYEVSEGPADVASTATRLVREFAA